MLENLPNPANLQQLDAAVLLVLFVFLGLGLAFIITGLRRYFQGRFIVGSLQSLSGLTFVLAGLLLFSLAMNLYTYQRLTSEQAIVDVSFTRLAPQRYQATLTFLDTRQTTDFVLQGDEWQLDARLIKWHALANVLGLDSQYRLERISGRYQDVEDEMGMQRSVYALHEKQPIDYWQLMHEYKKYLPWVDAYYGSATFLPMADNARFVVSVTQSGLVARPVNEAARQKTRSW